MTRPVAYCGGAPMVLMFVATSEPSAAGVPAAFLSLNSYRPARLPSSATSEESTR
jgi:hypothetical protein